MKRTAKSLLAMLVVLTLLVAAVPFAMMSTAAVTDAQGNVWTYGQYGTMRISKVEPADGVTELTFPTELDDKTIDGVWGGFASSDLNDVTSIIIPDGYKTIEGGAFKNFTTLEKIQIADSVNSIGTSAFQGCTSLTSFRFPDSFTNGQYQSILHSCTNLVSVDLNNVVNAHESNIDNCPNLKFVYTNANGCKFKGSSSDYYGSEEGVTFILGENVTTISGLQFQRVNIAEIVWPETTVVEVSGNNPFYFCRFLNGRMNFDNVKFTGSSNVADGSNYTTVDGTLNIYVGDKASNGRTTDKIFDISAYGTAATTVNLYFEGSNDGTWEVGSGKEFRIQSFSGTANVVENTAYTYAYGTTNIDPYFGAPVAPPAEPTVDWLASKVQLAVGTTAESDSTSMRILSTVDSLDYDAAGIEITINGKTTTLNSTVVYESIYAASGEGAELVTPVQVSGVEDSQYIIAKEIINIPAAAFDTEITIRAFCSVDETVSYGESRTVTVAGLI